jgi:hypothetical protein
VLAPVRHDRRAPTLVGDGARRRSDGR